MFGRKIILIMLAVIVLPFCRVHAYPNWDVYSDAVIKDGDIYNVVNVYDSAQKRTTVTMLGGIVDQMKTYDASILNVNVCDISSLYAWDYSTVNVLGGDVYTLWAWDSAVANVGHNASVFSLAARGGEGTVNMTGGIVERIGALEGGTINLSGGIVLDHLGADSCSIVNIYGYNLAKTNYGGSYGYGQVYGLWFDDSSFMIDLSGPDTYARINLIPEPSTLILLGLGTLLKKRKIQSHTIY